MKDRQTERKRQSENVCVCGLETERERLRERDRERLTGDVVGSWVWPTQRNAVHTCSLIQPLFMPETHQQCKGEEREGEERTVFQH